MQGGTEFRSRELFEGGAHIIYVNGNYKGDESQNYFSKKFYGKHETYSGTGIKCTGNSGRGKNGNIKAVTEIKINKS